MAASLVGQSLVFALATSPQVNAADAGPPTPKEQALIERACPAAKTAGCVRWPTNDASRRGCCRCEPISAAISAGCPPPRAASSTRPAVRCRRRADVKPMSTVSACSWRRCPLPGRARLLPAPADAPLPDPAVDAVVGGSVDARSGSESSLLSVQPARRAVCRWRRRSEPRSCSSASRPGAPGRCAASAASACPGRAISAWHAGTKRRRRSAAWPANAPNVQRADEAEQRRHSEHAEEQRQAQLRREEEERLRRLDDARRLEEEARRREEDARTAGRGTASAPGPRRRATPTTRHSIPTALSDWRPDAGGDEVRAAYEEARLKYDPDQVAHLGDDAQAHLRREVSRRRARVQDAHRRSMNRAIG